MVDGRHIEKSAVRVKVRVKARGVRSAMRAHIHRQGTRVTAVLDDRGPYYCCIGCTLFISETGDTCYCCIGCFLCVAIGF